VPNVQWKTTDDGQRNCPKHAEFLDKNKFGKISVSVGFIKKKFVTMHGHTNVKKRVEICFLRPTVSAGNIILYCEQEVGRACQEACTLWDFPQHLPLSQQDGAVRKQISVLQSLKNSLKKCSYDQTC
jgi:hypothetical protein